MYQLYELHGTGFGVLLKRDINAHPWKELAADLIGPWPIEIKDEWYELNALTSINMVINLVELIGVDRKLLFLAFYIEDARTTSKNSQANAICERMHQTVGNVSKTLIYSNPQK